jgi:pantetheine-phosphate adenylyltransferase
METNYVYPGSFCPPTYGHLAIIQKALTVLPRLLIICSSNPDKNHNWFTPSECAVLWQSYNLPANVSVGTFSQNDHDFSKVVMVRGIRNQSDWMQEKDIALQNQQQFGLDKFLYFLSDPAQSDISSSSARSMAEQLELEEFPKFVSPLVVTALLEKTLKLNNLYLVVGQPGAGKSTFLKMLGQESKNNVHINTDDFNHQLKPLLQSLFGQNLIRLALERNEELKDAIKKPWLSLLKHELKQMTPGSNVFVEIPFGLQPDKQMFRFIGGKILYLGCSDEAQNRQRIISRGTPELLPFLEKIPGLKKSLAIAREHKLSLTCIKTDGSLADLEKQAELFNQQLANKGVLKWKTSSPE